ncbi:MAG: Holliday junction branch migration protein RuvA [Clostridiales bacterium]|nr:Holliday junction branch migration protein RuvA [Clostridiales bacterium]
MIYSLTGEILMIGDNSLALECKGVGYLCHSTLNTLSRLGPIGSRVTLLTHLNVREDAMDLYGFLDQDELDLFKLLITVSGIGPKVSLAILSTFRPDQLALNISTGDTKSLTAAPGVGNKTAQRIVLELKDKLKAALPTGAFVGGAQAASASPQGSATGEAIDALVSLGYSQSQAAVAVSRLENGLTTEEMIKQALRILSRQ